MTKPPRITGRYERMLMRAEGARLPFVDDEPEPSPPRPVRVVRHAGSLATPVEQGPSEMTRVIFGSLAPSVQPAVNWLSTPKGGKVVATGAIVLGTLAVTRLLRA